MPRLVQRFAPAGAVGKAENARNLAKECESMTKISIERAVNRLKVRREKKGGLWNVWSVCIY